MLKLALFAVAALLLIFAPHLVTAIVAPLGAVVAWSGTQPAVLGSLLGYAARPHFRRLTRR